jgi:SSS family solute:Na+ symporter/sodium/proline symporter
MNLLYFWVIIAYLVVLILVGAWRTRAVKTQTDFMVAGRRLSARVLVGTLLATWIGSGSILAGAGLAYDRGLSALWFSLGVWIALIIMYFVAHRARALAQFTVPDLLEMRYNKWARLLGTVVTIISYTAIVSYQFRAGGMVLEMVTGIDTSTGIIITALFVIGYTVLAGMISVAYTDVVNGIIMIIGLVIALPFMLAKVGGIDHVVSSLPAAHLSLMGDMSLLEAAGYSLPAMLLLLGESGMYQRFFSARDGRTARRAVVGWVIATVLIETLIVVLAVIGSAEFRNIESETVILHLVKEGLPLVIGCLSLAAIVAVIVSTADSFLLVPATNVMRDIVQRFFSPDLEDRKAVMLTRIVVVALGLIAYVQVQFFERILDMAIYAYTMYGTGITPAVMAAFFWKRASAWGGVAAIVSGMLVTLAWEIAPPLQIPTVYPALIISVAALVFVSLISSRPKASSWQPFFVNNTVSIEK